MLMYLTNAGMTHSSSFPLRRLAVLLRGSPASFIVALVAKNVSGQKNVRKGAVVTNLKSVLGIVISWSSLVSPQFNNAVNVGPFN
jgi:hypothetical protein